MKIVELVCITTFKGKDLFEELKIGDSYHLIKDQIFNKKRMEIVYDVYTLEAKPFEVDNNFIGVISELEFEVNFVTKAKWREMQIVKILNE